MVLEGYTLSNQGMSDKEAKDSLAHILHATKQKQGKYYFILSGPQYEDGSPIEGYSYYAKFIRHDNRWFVYSMVYPNRYHDALTRLFKEIDDWLIWERPHLQLKQGEDQTPKDSF